MRPEAFFGLAERLCSSLRGSEWLFCTLRGEDSDFVRLNRSRIRQAGHVRTAVLGLTLIEGDRQVEGDCPFSGAARVDLSQARSLLGRLRERLAHVPDDPYLNVSTDATEWERDLGEIPDAASAIAQLLGASQGLDLVGIWAGGAIVEGLASSFGHRHWQRSASFNLDWSCFLGTDKAVKDGYSGFQWDPELLGERLARMREGLRTMARPTRAVDPGRYRAYLAPAAVEALLEMLAWDGFDLKGHRTHQTPLLRMARGERRFHPSVSLTEEHDRGFAPGFTPEGFLKPARVPLIVGGTLDTCLVDARSAKEYGESVNASTGQPESLGLAAGEMPRADVLRRLETGLYIGNLWYCNWSDPNDCRVTGMTRFGTYWVEDGALVSPLAVMRFDDSLFHLLGDRLEALTCERELILSAETYGGRSTDSMLLPGILVSGIELTL